jgi:folate-binding protein YgfZ
MARSTRSSVSPLPSNDAYSAGFAGASEADRAVRADALVVVEAERGVLSVSGSERVSWLNAVVTCDASSVTSERASFGLFLSKQGKIQTDFYVLSDGVRLLLAVAPDTAELVRAELERMLVMEDVELSDVSTEFAVLSLHGPRALELAQAEAARSGGAVGFLDLTGLGGAVLVLPRASLGEALGRFEASGARLSRDDDWRRVRVPHGVGVFGIDYGPSDNPHEAALERRAIAWNKGCYLGQEAVFMQDARGKVKRRLVVLRVGGSAAVPEGAAIERPNGERVGEVTSGAASGREAERFLLGKVHAPDFEPGTELVVGGLSTRVVARAFAAGGSPEAPDGRQTV